MTDERPPSRSAMKRAAKKFEELVQATLLMPEARFLKAPLAEELREEFVLARKLKADSSRKRQVLHLASMLRQQPELAEPLESYLQGTSQTDREQTLAFHRLEQLRDRLCDPASLPEAMAEVREQFPALEYRALERLALSVHRSQDKRAYREIFRRLRDALS